MVEKILLDLDLILETLLKDLNIKVDRCLVDQLDHVILPVPDYVI